MFANFSRLNISKMNMKRYDTYKDSGVRWLVPCSLECDTDGLLDEIMKYKLLGKRNYGTERTDKTL